MKTLASVFFAAINCVPAIGSKLGSPVNIKSSDGFVRTMIVEGLSAFFGIVPPFASFV
jgi:hypothetical protein